jgi:type VI secretion system protein
VLKYEPRVRAIDIDIRETDPGMLLSFTMVCHLHQEGLVRFGTHFTTDGQTRLDMLKNDLDRD